MPKNRTHSGTKKRIRVTATGKLMRQGTKMRHNLEKKSSHQTRAFSQDRVLAKSDVRATKKLLGL